LILQMENKLYKIVHNQWNSNKENLNLEGNPKFKKNIEMVFICILFFEIVSWVMVGKMIKKLYYLHF